MHSLHHAVHRTILLFDDGLQNKMHKLLSLNSCGVSKHSSPFGWKMSKRLESIKQNASTFQIGIG
jgi:hypothetical protein